MNTNISPDNFSREPNSSNTDTNDSANISRCSQWDEDEIFDGRPKPTTIHVLVVSPGEAPYSHELDNTLEAMQEFIGGTLTSFDTGVFDTVGIAHDEGLLLRLPLNRLIPTTGAASLAPSSWRATASTYTRSTRSRWP